MTNDKLSLYEICQDCGTRCCTEPGPPIVFPEEREQIIAFGKGNFIQKVKGKDYYCIPRDENGCPYLEDSKCVIHEVKPFDCKIYPIGIDENLNIGTSQDCPARYLLSNDFKNEAEKLINGLTKKQKKALFEFSKKQGYNYKISNENFGLELLLNLYGCNKDIISSKEKLIEYNKKICEVIDMVAVGEPIIPEKFGKGTLYGYSSLQFIQTSSIVTHIAEKMLEAYIDIFSCKEFDIKKAKDFTKDFFKARKVIPDVKER